MHATLGHGQGEGRSGELTTEKYCYQTVPFNSHWVPRLDAMYSRYYEVACQQSIVDAGLGVPMTVSARMFHGADGIQFHYDRISA